MYTLEISSRAEKNIEVAFQWYEKQRAGLGISFVDSVGVAIKSIQANPLFYGYRKRNIRGCAVDDFPFLILFYVKRTNVRVVNVFHTSRRVGKV